MPKLRNELGQATAEYALVMIAAAAIALSLIVWASSTGALPAFFDLIIDKVTSMADGGGASSTP